jgi:hypothetical protein
LNKDDFVPLRRFHRALNFNGDAFSSGLNCKRIWALAIFRGDSHTVAVLPVVPTGFLSGNAK